MPKSAPIIGTSERGPVPINVSRLIETRLLLQANSGGGKSWAIRRLLEQTHGQVQQIVIDLEDEFHTLREKFDYVLAGRDGGDCAAHPKFAQHLARKLLELQVSAILGINELKAHERVLFVRRFLEALIDAPRSLRHPVLVVVDEAHVFAPQKGEAESAGAVIDLMTRGRKRGLCGVLATQRISKLHKDAAAEANNKLIGRSALDVDMKRAADELGFSGRDEQNRLRTLREGEFFCFGPAFSDTVTLVKVGGVETTHPRAGEKLSMLPTPPRETVRRVLGQLADLPREAEEEARSVQDLQAKVRELERQVRAKPKPEADPAEIERAVARATEQARKAGEAQLKRRQALLRKLYQMIGGIVDQVQSVGSMLKPILAEEAPPATAAPVVKQHLTSSPRSPASVPAPRAERQENRLPPGEHAVLVAAAQYPDGGVTREHLSILTGYKRSSRDAYIQRLKEKDLVEVDGRSVVATEAGFDALGPDFQPLPTGADLREYWLNRLPPGEKAVLEVLTDAYPNAVSRESIDAEVGYQRSSRDAYLQRLKARQLIQIVGRGEVRAAEELF